MSNLQNQQTGLNRMPGSQMTGSQMPGSQFTGSQLPGSQMTGSQLPGSQFTGSQSIGTGPHILGKEPIIENRPLVVGQQPIIENRREVIGQQPIVEKRNVVVGQQPIVEQRPIVVGTQPIVQQKDYVVGQQPIIGEKPTIVGQRPVIQEKPAIVGERVLLEQRTQQPIFDPRLFLNQKNIDTSSSVGVFRHGARISLRSSKDRFLGSKGSRIKRSKRLKDTGIWLVESCGRDIFALRNASDGRYLSCNGHRLDFATNRGEEELWRVEPAQHEGIGKYLLSNYKGDFLSEGFLGMKLKDTTSYKTYWEAETV